MPFPMKIQPVDANELDEPTRFEPGKPVAKSRLKRLFERQFPSVLRNSAAEKVCGPEDPHFVVKDVSADVEPSSVCLAKMVQSFIEDSNEKQQSGAARCNRNRCNCFNGNGNESPDDEFDFFGGFGSGDSGKASSGEACEFLKGLVLCASVKERNLLADTSRIVDKNKICKRKDDFCRKVVMDELSALGYDASICKSRWEKSSSHPAGEYEYIDVIIDGERLLIDIDFRSEFEIARSTKNYKSILQTLPFIFVGKSDRLEKIISIVSEAAKQSLKKKGMHIPPWRKEEYVKAKWLSACPRSTLASTPREENNGALAGSSHGGMNSVDESEIGDYLFVLSEGSEEEEEKKTTAKDWKPPPVIKPKSLQIPKVLSGLASVIEDEL